MVLKELSLIIIFSLPLFVWKVIKSQKRKFSINFRKEIITSQPCYIDYNDFLWQIDHTKFNFELNSLVFKKSEVYLDCKMYKKNCESFSEKKLLNYFCF